MIFVSESKYLNPIEWLWNRKLAGGVALRRPDRDAFDELMDMYRSSFRRRVGLDLPSGIY
jgi:hypothetical protein